MTKKLFLIAVLGVWVIEALLGSGRIALAEPEATATIKGRVTADDGGPVGKVVVEAHPGGFGTRVDVRGFYTLTVPVDYQLYPNYRLHLYPDDSERAFVLPTVYPVYPDGLVVITGEVKSNVNITLSVGGSLVGTIVDAYARKILPISGRTASFVRRGNGATLVGVGASVVSGTFDINKNAVFVQRAMLPGDYEVTGLSISSPTVTTTHPIRMVARKTTTVTLIYDDPTWRVQDVLTVPGMPHVLGIVTPDRYRLLLSENAGASFTYVPFSGTTASVGTGGVALTRRAENDSSLRTVMVAEREPPVFSGHYSLLRSGDLGQSWFGISESVPNCGLHPLSVQLSSFDRVVVSPSRAQRLYAIGRCARLHYELLGIDEYAPQHQLFVSDDFGKTWEGRWNPDADLEEYLQYPVPNEQIVPNLSPLVSSPFDDSRLFFAKGYAYAPLKILESLDAGRTWITTTTSLTFSVLATNTTHFGWAFPITLVADGGLPNTLYLLLPEQGLSASSDAGKTWTNRTLPPNCASTPLAVPGKAGHLLMACAPDLYRSRDGGLSWQKLNITGRGLFVDYATLGRLYAERYKDLWASDDAGDTWRAVWNVPGAKRYYLPVVSKS